VDGQQVAQGRIEHTIRARFSLDETMDFGEDTGTPVVEEYAANMPFRFNGRLTSFMIHLDEKKLTDADQRELRERASRVATVRE
jgi:arylsulfatase